MTTRRFAAYGLGLATLVVLLLGGALAIWPRAAEPVAAQTVPLLGSIHVDAACDDRTSGYSDIRTGGQVTVLDAGGTVIALGHLADPAFRRVDGYGPYGCTYYFTVQVPPGHAFYGVKIGNESRGVMTVPAEKLRDRLDLTLGS